MHNHDHDLIAALAEGTLAGGAAEAAEAEISACTECSAGLAEQRLALSALASLPSPSLTSRESAELRASVAESIGIPSPSTAPARARSRRSPWVAIAAAAGVAAVITAVPVIGFISGAADDSGDAATTMVAAVDEFRDQTGADPEMLGGEAAEEMAATAPQEALSATTAAPETTEAAATTTAAVTDDLEVPPGWDGDGEEGIKSLYEAGPEQAPAANYGVSERSNLTCIAAAEAQFGEEFLYVDYPAALDDGRPVVLYAAADWSALVAFDVEDCSVAMTLP